MVAVSSGKWGKGSDIGEDGKKTFTYILYSRKICSKHGKSSDHCFKGKEKAEEGDRQHGE